MTNSNVVVVRGSLQEILSKLLAAKAVVTNREALGYRVLMPDELYRINVFSDACATCLPYRGKIVRGDELLVLFPDAVPLDEGLWALNRHRVCRCEAEWSNRDEVLASRLAAEIAGVV